MLYPKFWLFGSSGKWIFSLAQGCIRYISFRVQVMAAVIFFVDHRSLLAPALSIEFQKKQIGETCRPDLRNCGRTGSEKGTAYDGRTMTFGGDPWIPTLLFGQSEQHLYYPLLINHGFGLEPFGFVDELQSKYSKKIGRLKGRFKNRRSNRDWNIVGSTLYFHEDVSDPRIYNPGIDWWRSSWDPFLFRMSRVA